MTQQTALSILKTGANVFLTGEPGAGKTHTINQYTAWLREHGVDPAITASTGIAATHIGGMTIHSWSGIGIKKMLTGEDYARMLENERLVTRLTRTSVLIIDEISMLDARTLDAVDGVCRSLRQDGRPFGGIQIVFVGDFFQLPPVSRMGEPKPQFAYRSQAWRDAEPIVCYLSEQHRQQDAPYLSVLASMRSGRISEDGRKLLEQRKTVVDEEMAHTRLYSHNLDVDRVNQQKLLMLPGEPSLFRMETHGGNNYVEALIKSCLSPETLALKIGARVMFTKNNFEEGYVNGTLGEVESFEDVAEEEDDSIPEFLRNIARSEAKESRPIIRTLDGRRIPVSSAEWTIMDGPRTLGKIKQFPLRLAWAITVHKSQGMTLDAAVMDLSQAFEYGQGYVALSRVKASSGLHLLGWNDRALQVHPEVLVSDMTFREQSDEAQRSYEMVPAGMQKESEDRFLLKSGGSIEKTVRKEKKPKKAGAPKGATFEETLVLFKGGKTVEEIAISRGLVPSTIWNHLEKLMGEGKIASVEVVRVIPSHLKEALPMLHETLKAGEGKLSHAFETLRGRYSYDDLRLARMVMEKKEAE